MADSSRRGLGLEVSQLNANLIFDNFCSPIQVNAWELELLYHSLEILPFWIHCGKFEQARKLGRCDSYF